MSTSTSFSWDTRFKGIKALHILYLIILIELINVVCYGSFLANRGYLPAPFIMDKGDTFMDFYNPLFWVIKDGFYTEFHSIYPALNYFFLKLFSFGIEPENIVDSRQLREISIHISVLILGFYAFIVWCVVNLGEWRKINQGHQLAIFSVCLLSMPILFAFERANLIFLGLLFLALYLNASSSLWRAIFLAILVNIKPYFAVFLLPYLNKDRFDLRFIASVAGISAFLFLSLGWLAGMSVIGFFSDMFLFRSGGQIPMVHILALPHSIDALLAPISALGRPMKSAASFHLDTLTYQYLTYFTTVVGLVNKLTLLALVALVVLKRMSYFELLLASFIVITNLSVATGGYILIMYILLIPYLLNSNEYRKYLIPIVIIFSTPFDWIKIQALRLEPVESYLGGVTLENIDFYLGIGSVIRPITNYLLLAWLTLSLFRKYSKRI